MTEELEQLKLEKDLIGFEEDLVEKTKEWTKEQFEDRMVILADNINQRKIELDIHKKSKDMFIANPLLAEAPYEFMKTKEYAMLRMPSHLEAFDKKIADVERIIALQYYEIDYCKKHIDA